MLVDPGMLDYMAAHSGSCRLVLTEVDEDLGRRAIGGVERSPERPLIDSEAVFDLAEAIDPRYRALILLIAFGPGSRKGEFRAYRRRHVDLLHRRIRTEVQEQGTDAGLDTYVQPGPDGYLFTGPKGGPLAPVHWYKSFRLARAAVGLPELHPHDLRHAAGTFFAQQGATTREIMARLGHRSRAAADRYQHAAARRDAELATRLNTAAQEARSRRVGTSA